MSGTSVKIELSEDGSHDITTRRAFGMPIEVVQQAEEIARFYIDNYVPNNGNCAGSLLVEVEQSDGGDFRHTISFTAHVERVDTPEVATEGARVTTSADDDNVNINGRVSERERTTAIATTRKPIVLRVASVAGISSATETSSSTGLLPCAYCARRIIHDSKSIHSSNEDNKRPDLNGTVRDLEMACKYVPDAKCTCCGNKGRKRPCLEVPEEVKPALQALLVVAATVLPNEIPTEATKQHALESQRNVVTLMSRAKGEKAEGTRVGELYDDEEAASHRLKTHNYHSYSARKRRRTIVSDGSGEYEDDM